MAEDLIHSAVELASKGEPREGIASLRPLVLGGEQRDEVLYALAFCFDREGNAATAAYLYEQVLVAFPDFSGAEERLAKCRKALEERGVSEDFEDGGHRLCSGCDLRYRAEYESCPYCGTEIAAPGAPPPVPVVEAEVEDMHSHGGPRERGNDAAGTAMGEDADVDGTLEDIKELRDDALGKLKDLAESEPVREAVDKVKEVAHTIHEKVGEAIDSEKVKEVHEKLDRAGREAVERGREWAESEETKSTARKVERMGRDAADKIQELAESEPAQKIDKALRRGFQRLVDRFRRIFGRG